MKHHQNTRKKFIPPILLVIGECLITSYFYSKSPAAFTLSDHAFFWGMMNFLFSMVLFFGFENRGALSQFSPEPNAPYAHNAANFIGHTSKNYFERITDMSSGTLLLIISLVNFAIYYFSM